MNSINWSAPNIWVFIAQLVEHCSANAEAMGSNPVEALKIFLGLKFAIAFKLQVQLRWAHLHFMLYFKWSCLNSLTSLWFPLTRRIDSVFDTSTSTENRFKLLPSRTSDKTPDNGFWGSLIFLGCCCSGVFLWTCLCVSCAWFDFLSIGHFGVALLPLYQNNRVFVRDSSYRNMFRMLIYFYSNQTHFCTRFALK